MKKQVIGKKGESAVRKYLEQKGFLILEYNFRTKSGEIDIVVKKGDILSFTEVKTRTSFKCGLPEEAVDYRKQQKIRTAALEYIAVKGMSGCREMSFDVACVICSPEGEIKKIFIYECAF